jgi:hypothetical protein
MKSFRAAADRIVRQETSAPSDVSRLIGSAVGPGRKITSDSDEWDVRLATLATIGDYDALALVASKPARIAHARNISDTRALHGVVADVVDEVTRRGAAIQLRAPLALTDGREASEIMVSPLTAVESVEGALVALRIGRGFSAADAVLASSLGAVLSLEVSRAAAAARDARTLTQALALFELARIGLGTDALEGRLLLAMEVLAASLGHDVAQLWLLRSGGSLRLRAAHPTESLVIEIARPRDHAGLARALAGEALQITDPSLRSWIRRTTRALIIAPLRVGGSVSGLLAVGRYSSTYVDDDLEMARHCADFLAEIVANDARDRSVRAGVTRNDARPEVAEDLLTGS